MNIEVEVKIKIRNIDNIRKRISEKGKMIKSIRQIDEYYIPCHRDFFKQKPHPIEWLRIRKNPDKTVFEYDKSINKKSDREQDYAEEYETEISNPKEFKKILKFLDFKKIIRVDKKREYWNCGKLEIVLDSIESLGDFIEAEAIGKFKDPIEAKKYCFNFLKKIGIKNPKEKQIKKGYPVLLLDKKKLAFF